MNVLVVGGAGYVGSATCAALLEAGHAVTVYDNLSNGHVEAVPKDAELVIGETADPSSIDRVLGFRNFEVVMDFAALIEGAESVALPDRYFRNNTANTLTLIEEILRHGITRFVFSSSAAVYGDPIRVPVREDDRLVPTNPYGESKLEVERMLPWINDAYGMRYASLRYFNAAGAIGPDCGEDHRPESHLIPLVLSCALGKVEAVPIFGVDYPTPDGSCIRDYVHVADLASAHVLVADALSSHSRLTFNLGNGSGFSVFEVVEVARRVSARAIPVVESERRPGDPATLVAGSAAIHDQLGWTPRYPDLDSIVESAWTWHARHPEGFAQ